jgi:tungstate transport system substrate-binding protein
LLWRAAAGGALICALLAACTSERPLRFGTTSTVQHSGALALLDSLRDSAPARFAVAIGPSGQMLRSAAAGDLDVVLTHAPALEARWLAERWSRRCPFVTSRFAIVGPRADPAGVARAQSAADAMRRITRAGAMFVSRGDSSGTHERELAIWRTAGIAPEPGNLYFETGGDQATTLRLADEWGAYALADLPTLARQARLELAVLFAADSLLVNAYTLYLVRPDSAANRYAAPFAEWLRDRWRARVLTLRLADGSPAFASRPTGCDSSGT